MSLNASTSGLAALRRFARPAPITNEKCELCSAAIAAEHGHLVERANGRVLCVCEPCAILFGNQVAQKYCRVPRTIARLAGFAMDDAQWNNLGIPIGLAFLFHSSVEGGIVAVYPCPVGPMRSQPSAEAWADVVACNPSLATLEHDTEALLIHRIHPARAYFRAPLDECYKLVGLVRSRWRGVSGGTEVWETIADYFQALHRRASTDA
ncbi:MAG TPA: DUF5947 family protein [Pirellulales bacterium]|jgi:hypothetical protein